MLDIIFDSKKFEISGIPVPEFKLQKGKLIRIYIPNFDAKNLPLGFDMAIELIKHFKNQKSNFPWANNYRQNRVMEFLNPLTVHNYLINKMKINQAIAEVIIQEIGVNLTDKFEDLSFTKRKGLIIRSLFELNDCIMLDYYGVSSDGIGFLEKLVNSEIEKGKSAIAFDRLEFREDKEPYGNIEVIKIAF